METVAHKRSVSHVEQLITLLCLLLAALGQPLAAQGQQPPSPSPSPLPLPAGSPGPLPAQAAVTALAGDDGLALEVESLLANMTAADRVGQLFIINFTGSDLSADSDIALLIDGYRVGGVVISPQQYNFSNERGVDTPRQVAALSNQLQALAYGLVLPPEKALEPLPIAPWPPPSYETM